MGMTGVNFILEGYNILSSPSTFTRAIQSQTDLDAHKELAGAVTLRMSRTLQHTYRFIHDVGTIGIGADSSKAFLGDTGLRTQRVTQQKYW